MAILNTSEGKGRPNPPKTSTESKRYRYHVRDGELIATDLVMDYEEGDARYRGNYDKIDWSK